MYESSGKFPEGLFGSRTLQTFGLFDECLAVEAQSFNDTAATGDLLMKYIIACSSID